MAIPPSPSTKQIHALELLEDVGPVIDHHALLAECGVADGYSNEAMFLLRLLDRGWVRLELTPMGRATLRANRE